jgi:hypothetical protein
MPRPNTIPAKVRFPPPSPKAKVSPPTTMATRPNPFAIGPVNDVCKTFTAFSQGELPWPKAGAATKRPIAAAIRKREWIAKSQIRMRESIFTRIPPLQIRKPDHTRQRGEALRVLHDSRKGIGGRCENLLFAPCCPPQTSGHNWSFSSTNSADPRSRLFLPQSERDTERLTGEPGVALLTGVRGENSPHLYRGVFSGKCLRLFSVPFIFLAIELSRLSSINLPTAVGEDHSASKNYTGSKRTTRRFLATEFGFLESWRTPTYQRHIGRRRTQVVIHFTAVFVSLQALNYGSGQFSLKTVSKVAQELTQSLFFLGGTEKLGITLAESL